MYHLVISTNDDYHVHLVKKVSKLFFEDFVIKLHF